jgi:hypothetical protein
VPPLIANFRLSFALARILRHCFGVSSESVWVSTAAVLTEFRPGVSPDEIDAGPSQRIAEEVLGLSKIKLPATLQSSTEIARIGALLQRFGAASYDYRLFI